MPTGTFTAHITGLTDQAETIGKAAAAPGLTPRQWQLPPNSPTDGTDIQDPAFWITAMERGDLNDKYVDAFTETDGRRGKAMAYKAAVDYMGAYERAVQARYASGLRCRVWAGARRSGHGEKNYGVFAAVTRQLDNWLGATSEPEIVETELIAEG